MRKSHVALLLLILVVGGAAVGVCAPGIAELALSPAVERYAAQELTFLVTGIGIKNPYDVRDISVTGHFSAPSGRVYKVPAFYHEAYDPIKMLPGEVKAWKLRFTPEEVGTYLVRVVVSYLEREPVRLVTIPFQCTPSRRDGFIRRKGKQLVFNSGKDFFPLGANRCWEEAGVPQRYFADMRRQRENGANCIRVWLSPWWLPIEGRAGEIDQGTASLLDLIVKRAEKLGLKIILCIEQHGNLQPRDAEIGKWPDNPYNAANGGPCERRIEFFTKPEARRLLKQRLRYLVARWGYSTSIMAWELFNEIEWIQVEDYGFEWNRRKIEDWHVEMAEFLRATDPFAHPVTTSSDIAMQEALLKRKALDFMNVHLYKDETLARRLQEIIVPLRESVDVPILLGEFGPVRDGDDGRKVIRGIFVTAMAGVGGGALPWLQDVKEPGPFYERIDAARRFFANVQWGKEEFKPIHSEIVVRLNVSRHGGGDLRATLPEPVHVLGLRGKVQTLLFAFTGSDEGAPRNPQWVRFRIPGIKPGTYGVEVWSPVAGRAISHRTVEAGKEGLLIDLPECLAEMAIKIEAKAGR